MFSPVVYSILFFFLVIIAIVERKLIFALPKRAPGVNFHLFFPFCVWCLNVAHRELSKWLESLAYRTWLELFDHDVPEEQRSLQWKLWWNIMDEGKYADIRWEQWGASWQVTKRVWTRLWDVVWTDVALRRSGIDI